MPRLAIVLSLLLLAAVPPAADGKVRKGPSGAAFYTPPKGLVKGAHGSPIWARRLTGSAALQGGRRNRLLLYRSTGITGSVDRGVRDAGGAEGPPAQGRLAADLVGPRDDRDRRPVRAVARRRLGAAAARALAEGGLRGRPHRLRGPRHAGRAPVSDREVGGPLRARRRTRRAQARQAHRQALRHRRALAGRAGGAVRGVAGTGATRASSSSAARSPSRPRRTWPSSPRCSRASRPRAR